MSPAAAAAGAVVGLAAGAVVGAAAGAVVGLAADAVVGAAAGAVVGVAAGCEQAASRPPKTGRPSPRPTPRLTSVRRLSSWRVIAYASGLDGDSASGIAENVSLARGILRLFWSEVSSLQLAAEPVLARREAAIDREHGAGHERSLVGSKESRGARHVRWYAYTSDGVLRTQP